MEEGFSIEKNFPSRREPKKSFLLCVSASLRELKKEEAMPASKSGSGYESGRYLTPRRKDAKTQRRKEGK